MFLWGISWSRRSFSSAPAVEVRLGY